MSDLYKEELLDIYRNPLKKGKLENPTVEVFEKNPYCGDELHLQLIVENGVIKDAKFHGNACAVSVISSEILIESIIGKNIEEVKSFSKDDLLNLIGMNLTTSRISCATLVLKALKEALKKHGQTK